MSYVRDYPVPLVDAAEFDQFVAAEGAMWSGGLGVDRTRRPARHWAGSTTAG